MKDPTKTTNNNQQSVARWVIGNSVMAFLFGAVYLAHQGGVWQTLSGFLLVTVFGSAVYVESRDLFEKCVGTSTSKLFLRSSLIGALGLWAVTAFNLSWIAAYFWSVVIIQSFFALKGSREFAMQRLGVETGLIVWILIPISAALAIWTRDAQGPLWILWLGLIVKGADATAYFIGPRWGRRPFFSKISPKKTLEGFLAALLFGVLAGGAAFAWFELGKFWVGSLMGFGFALLGAFGDLGESLLKRQAGIKDSGPLPGIGGVLDIFDALLPAFPMLWVFLSFAKIL